jgi:hypothetical protein
MMTTLADALFGAGQTASRSALPRYGIYRVICTITVSLCRARRFSLGSINAARPFRLHLSISCSSCFLCPSPHKGFGKGVWDRRSPLSPAREERSRGHSSLFFQTHGLHLKDIDSLGSRVIENSGGEATPENQRGIDVVPLRT